MKHHVERTSPKGPGRPFIGTCRLCGIPNLPASAVLQDCENPRGLSLVEALVETVLGIEPYCVGCDRLKAGVVSFYCTDCTNNGGPHVGR